MKTYDLKDIFPPKVKITKDGNYLEISGNEDLVQENHAFVFTSVYDFERTNNKSFIKKTDDFEATLRVVSEYLKEQKFEFTGDAACQEIINRLDSSEKDFYIAQRRGQEIKNSNVADLHVPHFIRSRRLKSYQLLPVHHMLHTLNAANFSIPGSGKTTMAYAVYDKLKSNSDIDQLFVIGPLSSFKPWEEEFTNCFGLPYGSNVLRYAGSPHQRAELSRNFTDFEVILTSIPIAINDFEILKTNLFHGKNIMLVLDESHHIKSFTENATHANKMIDIGKFAKKKIILTGTPMPHSWPDLWSQITFLYPDERVLGSRSSYRSIIDEIDAEDHISNKINFLWTRVTYKQMKKDLPDMHDKLIPVPMSPLQNQIYQDLENDWITSLGQESDFDTYQIIELKRVKTLRLLQCVTNPGAIAHKDIEFALEPYATNMGIMEKLENYKEVPNKMMKAAAIATKLAEEEKNVIIWTIFRHNVKYLCNLLSEMNPIGISGEIPTDTRNMGEIVGRDDLIQAFKNSKGKIMVATLGSIAESVSLHRNEKNEPVCQNAIYLERNFNAGQFMQSLFRLYRIGPKQTTPVTNFFLSSTFDDGRTRTIDDEVSDRLKQRIRKMFRLLNDDVKLTPLSVDVHNYTVDGKSQFYDEFEDQDMIYNKIFRMIKKHQQAHKI